MNIIDIAKEGGLTLYRQGDQLVCLCPVHAEKRPSFSINPLKEPGVFLCRSCGVKGGALELAKILGVSVRGQTLDGKTATGDFAPIPTEKPRLPSETVESIEALPIEPQDDDTLKYIEQRGWWTKASQGVLVFSRRESVYWKGGYRVGLIQRDEEGRVSGAQFRNTVGKEPRFVCVKGSRGVFGNVKHVPLCCVENHPAVYIVEGMGGYIAALSLSFPDEIGEMERKPVVIGLPGAQSSGPLNAINYRRGTTIGLIFDNDRGGWEGQAKVWPKIELDGATPSVVKFDFAGDFDDYHRHLLQDGSLMSRNMREFLN